LRPPEEPSACGRRRNRKPIDYLDFTAHAQVDKRIFSGLIDCDGTQHVLTYEILFSVTITGRGGKGEWRNKAFVTAL